MSYEFNNYFKYKISTSILLYIRLFNKITTYDYYKNTY